MGKAKGADTAAQDTTNANDTAAAPVTEQPVADVTADVSAGNNIAVADTAATPVAETTSDAPAETGAEAPPAGVRDLIAQLPDGDHKAAILAALDADATEAQNAAAPLVNPLAVPLKAPDNISSVSIQGREYQVNQHGLIEIAIEDAHHIAIALEHGFQRAVKAVRNLL